MNHINDGGEEGDKWWIHVAVSAPHVHGSGGRFNGVRHITVSHGHRN